MTNSRFHEIFELLRVEVCWNVLEESFVTKKPPSRCAVELYGYLQLLSFWYSYLQLYRNSCLLTSSFCSFSFVFVQRSTPHRPPGRLDRGRPEEAERTRLVSCLGAPAI